MAAELAEKNRAYFDKKASVYNSEFWEGVKLIIEEVKARRSWISSRWTDTPEGQGQEIRVLEYACGNGNVSMALSPYVSKIIGVDISDNMVAEFNKEAEKAGLFPEKASAVRGDLLADQVDEKFSQADYSDFDLVVVSLAFHHFPDADDAARRLGSRLKEGGVLFIIDGLPDQFGHHHEHHKHEAFPTIQKHGFSENEIRDAFTHGGVAKNFKFSIVDKPMVFTHEGKRLEKTVFLARGERSKL